MVDKKLSEFNDVEKSSVSDLVVLYNDGSDIRNGKLSISEFDQYYNSLYLTQTDASSIYLNKTDAHNTYLNKTDASNTYLNKTDAGNTYLSISSASNTYLNKTDASNTYLNKTDAEDTYLNKTDAEDTYLTQETASETYLTKDQSFFNILDYKWSDYILNDIRWLNSETFSWQSGLIYKSAYDHLKEDYENADIVQTWQPVKLNENLYNTSHKWVGLCYNGTQIFAISEEGYISTSEDGKTWTNPELLSGFSTILVRDIAYGNGIFVVLTAYGISTSTDGYNWTSLITIPNSTNLEHLLFANNEFILYDEVYNDIGKIFKSSNGINWTGYTVTGVEAGEDIGSLAYGNDMYIMTRFAGLYVYTSSDAINWTKHEINGIEGLIYNIIFDGNDFIAFTNRNNFYASSNAINWTLIPNTPKYTTIGNHWSGTTNDSTIYLIDDYGYSALRKDLSYETIGSYSIEYILAKDGHKIVMPDQESIVEDIYNESGTAWYYILDTTNQRFKLPRENPAREELIQTIRARGNGNTIGYQITADGETRGVAEFSSYRMATTTTIGAVGDSASVVTMNQNKFIGLTKDSTKSGIISNMTDSTSVYKGKKYLYFYVGQFSQSAIEQTAGLNTELFNTKADADLSNINPSQAIKETIIGWGIPDWSAGISLANNSPAPSHGIIYTSRSISNDYWRANVNGVTVAYEGGSYNDGSSAIIPVSKGDIITSGASMTFFPYKGVHNA